MWGHTVLLPVLIMNYCQLKKAVKAYNKSLPSNIRVARRAILERSSICILSLNHIFKIFHCFQVGDLIIQELYDGRWRVYASEPGRADEYTLYLGDNESEACEEFLRQIKKYYF